MCVVEIFLIAVSLALDAFAVSVSSGIAIPGFGWKQAVKMGVWFGAFQFAMPLAGWLLGSSASGYIQAVDHWVAFGLLAVIGGNMVREAMSPEEEEETACAVADRLDLKRLFMMAIATSIDALAVGVTFAFFRVKILPAVTIIGLTTFCISLGGVVVGNFFGTRYKKRAELTGGIVLILLGAKILLEHLGIL